MENIDYEKKYKESPDVKELSVEEKAKRYDEAFKRAKKWYNDPHITIGLKGNLGDIFPELKESEDERIKGTIIHSYFFDKYVNAKLKEKKPTDKVKCTQEVLEKHINSMSNKDDERLRKTTIAFLKDFADKGYENAVECIDWFKKQGEQKETLCDKCKKEHPSHSCQDITALGRCAVEHEQKSNEKIIKRIRQACDTIYEKYEGNPLIEKDDILEPFEDIINDYYEDLSPM